LQPFDTGWNLYLFENHISTLYSSVVFPWLLLFLLSSAVITYITYPPFLKDCVSVVFSKISRRYSDTSRLTPIIFSHLFLIGSLGMCMWLCMYEGGELNWLHYGVLVGIVGLWLLIRFLLARFIGYVFTIHHETQAIEEDSVSLLMLAALLMFVLCCVGPLVPMQAVLRVTAVCMMGLYIMIMFGKVVLTYARSIRMLFYIILYVSTVEIIPLFFVYGMGLWIKDVV